MLWLLALSIHLDCIWTTRLAGALCKRVAAASGTPWTLERGSSCLVAWSGLGPSSPLALVCFIACLVFIWTSAALGLALMVRCNGLFWIGMRFAALPCVGLVGLPCPVLIRKTFVGGRTAVLQLLLLRLVRAIWSRATWQTVEQPPFYASSHCMRE